MEAIRHQSGYYLKHNKGRIEHTSDISKASKFQNGKAQIYIESQIKKTIRNNYYVEKIYTKSENTILSIGQTNTTLKDNLTPNITLKNNEVTQLKENVLSDCYVLKCDIDKIVGDFTELIKQVNLCKPVLEGQLSQINKELTDIEHAMEFFKLNASGGYNLYKLFHEKRLIRRDLKDRLLKIEIINESTFADWKSGTVFKRINGMNNRQYLPRAMNKLFEQLGDKVGNTKGDKSEKNLSCGGTSVE